MIVACMIVALVSVIGIIGAVVSTLSYDRRDGRSRLRRESQLLRAIEAALAPSQAESPPRCAVPRAHQRSRRR